MNRTVVVFVVCISALAVTACSDNVPTPTYGQSRAIDQDIDATHANLPAPATPSFANEDRDPSPLPWRNEEQMDQEKTLQQTGQLPQ